MTRTTLTLLALAALATAPTHAAPGSGAKAAIQALYNHENTAAANKDVQGTVAYVSPNCKGLDSKGKSLTYDDLVQNATQVFSLAKSIQSETTVSNCKVVGNKATVSVSDTINITVAVPGSADMAMVDKSTADDTWIKTKAGWRMIYSHVLTHSATLNGQPAPEM